MIKRALGLILGADGNEGDQDDSVSDEEVARKNAKAEEKLSRRLLPGYESAPRPMGKKQIDEEEPEQLQVKAKAKCQKLPAARRQAVEEEEDEDDDDDDNGSSCEEKFGEPSDESSTEDEGPSEKKFRGKFHCRLCPDKVILNEKVLETHMESASHKRNEQAFLRAKEIGTEAYIEECRLKAEKIQRDAEIAAERARKRAADPNDDGVAMRTKRKEEHWKIQKEKQKTRQTEAESKAGQKKEGSSKKQNPYDKKGEWIRKQKEQREARKSMSPEERAKSYSQAEIDRMKEKFQKKKARRLAKQAAEEGAATAPAQNGKPPSKDVKQKGAGAVAETPQKEKHKKKDTEVEALQKKKKGAKVEADAPDKKKRRKEKA